MLTALVLMLTVGMLFARNIVPFTIDYWLSLCIVWTFRLLFLPLFRVRGESRT